MRLSRALGVVSCFALALASRCALATTPDSPATPEKLVRAALETEIAGNPADRARLLAEALAIDPNFAPARWQSGFVRIGDEWVKLADVPNRTAGDQVLAAYRKKREGLVDTADNHRELARWCHKNKLVDEERVHWAHVLEFNQQDTEALAALGLQLYQGRLMTRAQIEREKVAAGERMQAMRAWQPKLTRLKRALESGVPKKVDEAHKELAKITDPAAIPALETVFAVDGSGEKVVALNRALVETIGRLRQPAATQVLLRRAVGGEPEQVRDLAIDELKKRPMHAYVPQLIAALPGAIKTKFHVFVLSGGTVLHEHEVFLEGREANVSLTFDSTVQPADAITGMLVTPQATRRELVRAASIERQAAATAEQMQWVRDRAQTVLARTTGFANADDPELWQRQYNDYQGWQTETPVKPTYALKTGSVEGYAMAPTDTQTTFGRAKEPHNCFPAGTTIWTNAGPRAIEDVKMGDRVLSQDPSTGELVYKPVQVATLRSNVPLLRIHFGAKSLLATRGHPFWVAGEGWLTAQHLKPGSRLHGLEGSQEVTSVEPAQSSEVYNFVVSELHNYFVGPTKVLVHDNSPLAENPQRVPGLAAADLDR